MLNNLNTFGCACGKEHRTDVKDVIIGSGVIGKLGSIVKDLGAQKVFLLADKNTFAAAGEQVCKSLFSEGITTSRYVFSDPHLEPDERSVGAAIMHFDTNCDLIIGIGAGVINDIGKILSHTSGKRYIIVATAPSMDGYASATSSMSMDGLKVSLNSRCADIIVGDTDILKNAPERLLKSGLGDMLAKYVSIAEWRIAHIITGEYYCEAIAELIRSALRKCVDNADGLLERKEDAVEAVFEGLVIGGVAMAYAGVSRPASGVEHYFSHIWDMRGLEFGTPVDLHGIQCAVGTLLAIRLYEKLVTYTPNREIANAYVDRFSYEDWKAQLRAFLGSSAETMIEQEKRENKYDKTAHKARFAKIQENWNTILQILREELPSAEELGKILDTVGISGDVADLGVDENVAKMTLKATKDIRDKYVLSRLAWDLGVLDELCELL